MAGTNNLNITSLTVGQTSKEATVNDMKGLIDSCLTEDETFTFSGADASKTATAAQFREAVFFKITGSTSNADPDFFLPDSVKRGLFLVWNDLGKDLIVKTVSGAISTTLKDDEIRLFASNGTEVYVASGGSGGGGAPAVRVATLVNGTLASAFENGDTVDGVVLATGDRILIKNQSTGAENGLYTVNASGAPTRTSDVLTASMLVTVAEGSVQADTVWMLTTNGTIIPGTTALVFAQLLPQDIYWAASVRVATTANGTLASAFENGDTIDGVVLATSDRILIKDQSAPAENGIYVVQASGAPVRATDFDDAGTEVRANAAVAVREGTANANKSFILATNNPIVVGTTGLSFVPFSAAAFGINVAEDTGTSYTYVLGDANTWKNHNNAAAITATVPANSTTAFPIGTQITAYQKGAGQVTFAAAGGVTIRTPETLKIRVQFSVATITKIATDEWVLAGDLELA